MSLIPPCDRNLLMRLEKGIEHFNQIDQKMEKGETSLEDDVERGGTLTLSYLTRPDGLFDIGWEHVSRMP